MLDSLKQLLGSKSAGGPKAAVKGKFVLVGTNEGGNYVLVSREGYAGRGIFYVDGSFEFIEMDNPDDVASCSPEDRKILTVTEQLVPEKDLNAVLGDLMTAKKNLSELEKQKEDAERECESLRARVQSLEAERNANEIRISQLEDDMREAAKNAAPAEDMHGSMEGYGVRGVVGDELDELEGILEDRIGRNLPAKAVEKSIEKYMNGERVGDVDDYLKLAAFTSAVAAIRDNKKAAAGIANLKEVNGAFLADCAEALRSFSPDGEYDFLDMHGKAAALEEVIQPLVSGYVDRMLSHGGDMKM